MSIATFASNPNAVTLKDPYVLHGRPLRPGARLQDTSRYSHDVWHLAPARLKIHEYSMILNFLSLPQRFRQAVKQLFYALLSLKPPDGEPSPTIATIRGMFTEMRRFLMWLDKRWSPERNELSALSSSDLEDYGKHLLARFPNNRSQRESSRGGVRLLWRWRLQMDEHALRFEPLHLDGWRESSSTGRGENKTDRLPEEVLGPLLVWALRFIDDFAPDILEADREWRASREKHIGPYLERSAVGSRLQAILDEYIAVGRPLPGWRGQPSLTHFSRLLGCRHDAVRPHQAALAAAAAVVGVTEGAFLDGSVQGCLDGEPWVDSIATNHESANSLARLSRILHASCYVVIAFLSGMRESEVKNIKRDCIEIKYDEDGRPYRWKLSSLAFKGEDEVEGVPATWTVCATVVRAVEMLEKLQPKTCDYLFTGLLHGNGAKKSSNKVEGNRATNTHLNDLVAFVNQLCADRGRSDIIADSAGRPFKLKTSYFRRTLAWFIARHPGGVIAGALQYRHRSIRMFEGYAGTSDSGFRAEVESEQAIARGEVYMEMIEAHQHLNLAGPSAEEATRRLTDFGDRAQFQGQVALDKHRLRRIMKRNDPAIYPGEYITCVNDPAKALCEKARRGNSEGLPAHGGCLPLACRNVTLTPENVGAWQREIARIDKRLGSRPTLAPRLKQLHQNRRAEVVAFLEANGQEVIPA
ncbi:hypothetical protein GCM10010347_29690 [Streptomyces cirratus]|uniref:Integrase n=1 Tax=Streptomyces cirratus TaxID=68187 RepID=A0ABQ3EV41_9ACTN|nr:hypothetical protein [Streptomyces cirratus]GHB57609.1 hypothetical protein GCM10010347_29690 [Streptomyces cirratus]